MAYSWWTRTGVFAFERDGQANVWAASLPGSAGNCAEECAFYHPDKVTRLSVFESPTGRAMRGESVDGEEIFVARLVGGPGTWSNVTARPLRDENGLIHGAVAVFRDISAQKLAAVQQETCERSGQRESMRKRPARRKIDSSPCSA